MAQLQNYLSQSRSKFLSRIDPGYIPVYDPTKQVNYVQTTSEPDSPKVKWSFDTEKKRKPSKVFEILDSMTNFRKLILGISVVAIVYLAPYIWMGVGMWVEAIDVAWAGRDVGLAMGILVVGAVVVGVVEFLLSGITQSIFDLYYVPVVGPFGLFFFLAGKIPEATKRAVEWFNSLEI